MKIFKRIKWRKIRLHTSLFKGFNIKKRNKAFWHGENNLEKQNSLEEVEASLTENNQSLKCLRRATKDDLLYDGSFHEAVAPVLTLAQIFAIMPVRGLRSKNVSDLSFEWFSLQAAYGLFIFSGLCFYFYLTVRFVATNHFILVTFDPVVFYGSVICIFIVFVKLAKKWPKLMKSWYDVESCLPKYNSQLRKGLMARKFKMILMVVLVCSMIEHLLSIIVGIHTTIYCDPDGDFFENFLKIHLFHIFTVTEFSQTKAILGKFVNIIGTFIWSYMDMFVMVVSEGLSDKFRQINENLIRFKGKDVPEEFWRKHRSYYQSVCDLCEEVDDAISGITIVSFSNNLYFICVQLLKTLHQEPSFVHKVYFWFSMMFLFSRTVAVSLYTSAVNDESKKPLQVFRWVPMDSWCLEVKRFSQEVNSGMVALTGMKFFELTRGLLCSVAGVIVTYELVLFQFKVNAGVVEKCSNNNANSSNINVNNQ